MNLFENVFRDDNKKIWVIISAVAVVVVAGLIGWYAGRNVVLTETGYGPQAGSIPKSQTRQAVSAMVSVPDTKSSVPGDVAKPQIVAQASPSGLASFRSFSLSLSKNEFMPNTVIVNAGDVVHISIKAVDKDYDFFQPDYGLSKPLPKGVSTVLEFQAAAADKYTFYCKSCGGPSRGPVGYVVVVPKK